MNFEKKVRRTRQPDSFRGFFSKHQIHIQRIVEPKRFIDLSSDIEYLSQMLHYAHQAKASLYFCVINLIHYLKDTKFLDFSDFQKKEMFFAFDPLVYWNIRYHECGGVHPLNVSHLTLSVRDPHLELSKILSLHFESQIRGDTIKFYIPIEYVVNVTFYR
jgi:hypothetical protein